MKILLKFPPFPHVDWAEIVLEVRKVSAANQPQEAAGTASADDAATTTTLSEARSRLDRSRFSRPNTHFLAFFKIYKKIIFSRANLANFCQKIAKFCKIFDFFLANFAKNFFSQNFSKFSEIREFFAKFCRIFFRILQKVVDFEKC